MATPVIMPRQGQSVETCIITKWFKNKGDSVAAGDLLFAYETDKAAFEMEAPADGIMLAVLYPEGSEVPVLHNVAVIGSEGEDISTFVHLTDVAEKKEASETINDEPVGVKQTVADETNTLTSTGPEKVRISPRARKIALEKGISIHNITGTGPNGRIVSADVEKHSSHTARHETLSAGPSAEYSDSPVTNIRKLIAKAMHSSLQNSAQLTHHMSADARNILGARAAVKKGLAAGTEKQDITLNDMICWCVIKALAKFPEMNSHFLGDTVRHFNNVHLGMAVDTPRGLMVPALKNAGSMDIRTLSASLRNLAEAARKGNVDPELIKSTAASFTVSNLGNYGVEMFTPVINLPQSGILGVCTITHRPADIGNNTFGFVPFIGLSLTYDHRAVDGGPATLFLKEIKDHVEKFSL